jgi:subtilase family serine protease
MSSRGRLGRGFVLTTVTQYRDADRSHPDLPEGAHYDQYRIGGTSLSSPLLAGVMALADQYAGQPHGFINPVLHQRTLGTTGITDVRHVTGAMIRHDFANGLDASNGIVNVDPNLGLPGHVNPNPAWL